MAAHTTAPEGLRTPHDPAPALPAEQNQSGRWEREAEEVHQSGPEDLATRTSRIYFFVIVAIVAASLAVFLILRPQ